MVVKIKDLPVQERPYEKLAHYGVSSLSNEELLAILLKSGYSNKSSKDLAIELLVRYGLESLDNVSFEELNKVKGIGLSKACILLSSIELGKRITISKSNIKYKRVTSTTMVYEYFKSVIGNTKQEQFYALYLDNSKRVIHDKLLFQGTLNYSVVHPREIFKEAYQVSASAIICIHNHPSGNINPSHEDIELTKRIENIGILLGIPLLDHIIIGIDSYYSLLEHNDMGEI